MGDYWGHRQQLEAEAAAAARKAEEKQRWEERQQRERQQNEIKKIVEDQLPAQFSTLKSEIKSELPNIIIKTIQTDPIKPMLEQYIQQQVEGKMKELKGSIDAQLLEQQRLLEDKINAIEEKLKNPVFPPTQKPTPSRPSGRNYLMRTGGKRNKT